METDKTDKTDKTNSHRLSGVSGLVAAAGLFAVVVGGYLYYQSREGADVSSELQQEPISPAPGAEGSTSPGSQADAASNSSSQQAAADASTPAGNLPNQSSQTPPPSIEAWRAGTQPQGQADDPAAPTNSGNATEPAPAFPPNARSRPTSLPTNDIAYVQGARANIRSKPSVDAKLVGQADKGSKLNVVRRDGKWVQVERGATRGWVSGNLLGPRLP
jgi:hypothetical protein